MTTPPRRRRGEARTYDFRRPVRLARDQAHLLRVAMTTFTRQATTVLTTSLRAVCQLHGTRLDELSYDEYLGTLTDRSVSAVLSLEPLPGKALLNLDLRILLTMVDHQLGGPGATEQPERPLTEIEQVLVKQLLTRVVRELAYALEPIARIEPHVLVLEPNASFVQAAAPTDPVVVMHMDLNVGQYESKASLCLPYSMLAGALAELAADGLDGERARVRLAAHELTTERLSDVEVDVSVRFDPMRMRSAQIAALQVGDVLPLIHRTATPLTVTSAAATFAHAVPGSAGKRLAVLIVDPDS